VSLAGLPSPRSRTVTFTVTDINGTIATASQSFEHNRRAVVTIETPPPDAVVQSSVRIRITCQDDVPTGCINLKVSASAAEPSPISQELAAGVTHFDQDVSLALFDGREVIIGAQGHRRPGPTFVCSHDCPRGPEPSAGKGRRGRRCRHNHRRFI
jgi:hypothetical protein